jgi:hypothetical protein
MLSTQQSPGRVVLTEQVQSGVVESQKCTIDFGGKSAAESGKGFKAEVKVFLLFSVVLILLLFCLSPFDFLSSRLKGEI